MVQIEGDLQADNLKIAFVVARFNEFICEQLLEGALDSFVRHGGNKDNVTVIRVPGAFELPLAAKRIAMNGKNDAVVCLGAVIVSCCCFAGVRQLSPQIRWPTG